MHRHKLNGRRPFSWQRSMDDDYGGTRDKAAEAKDAAEEQTAAEVKRADLDAETSFYCLAFLHH